jgi:predicted dehydrogenase
MGCGAVSDFGHIPAILGTDGLELVSLFDPNRARVEATSAKFGGIRAYTNQDEFLDSGLDAVVIASPAPAHRENVLAAADRRLHVFCEKPIAMNDHEGAEMIDAMKKADRLLVVGLVYRFSPVALQIRRWIQDGLVGDVRSLRLIYIWDLHGQYEPTEAGTWIESPRWRGRMLEGGPMVDCGVHQIDLARWWLSDEVARYDARAAWVAEYEAPDHVYVHMDHVSGAHTMVEMSFTYGHTVKEARPHFSYHIIGTGGVIRYNREGYVFEARTGQETLRVPGASEKNFPGMHAAFAEALRTGEIGNLASAEDALIATRIAREATDQAIAQRLPVVKKPVPQSEPAEESIAVS